MEDIKVNKIMLILAICGFFSITIILWITHNQTQVTEGEVMKSSKIGNLKASSVNELVKTEGVINSIFTSDKGMTYITIADETGDVEISMFANYGSIKEPLAEDDRIEVLGILSTYQGRLQIQPISKETLDVIEKASKEKNKVIALEDIEHYLYQKVTVGPVQIDNFDEFTSKAGKTHLRFDVESGTTRYSGIMYEGVWDRKDKKLLKKSKELYLVAKIELYNDEISIQVEKVEE